MSLHPWHCGDQTAHSVLTTSSLVPLFTPGAPVEGQSWQTLLLSTQKINKWVCVVRWQEKRKSCPRPETVIWWGEASRQHCATLLLALLGPAAFYTFKFIFFLFHFYSLFFDHSIEVKWRRPKWAHLSPDYLRKIHSGHSISQRAGSTRWHWWILLILQTILSQRPIYLIFILHFQARPFWLIFRPFATTTPFCCH